MLNESEKKRLREMNQKNAEFNENIYRDARSFGKGLCLVSILVLIVVIIYFIMK